MSSPHSQAQKIHARKSIINVGINAQIKSYQQKLVALSFSKDNVTDEYNEIVDKIKFLRKGVMQGRLHSR